MPYLTAQGALIWKSGQLGVVQRLLTMVVEVFMFRLIHGTLIAFIMVCIVGIASAKEHPTIVGEVLTSLPTPTILDITACE